MCACAARVRETSESEMTRVLDQDIDDAVAAVEARPRVIDLRTGDQADVLQDAEHVIFVLLHG